MLGACPHAFPSVQGHLPPPQVRTRDQECLCHRARLGGRLQASSSPLTAFLPDQPRPGSASRGGSSAAVLPPFARCSRSASGAAGDPCRGLSGAFLVLGRAAGPHRCRHQRDHSRLSVFSAFRRLPHSYIFLYNIRVFLLTLIGRRGQPYLKNK